MLAMLEGDICFFQEMWLEALQRGSGTEIGL